LVFVDFDFDGTRAHAVSEYSDRQSVAYRFVFPKRAVVVFGNTDSFADAASADGCTFQKSQSPLDWTGGNGWARLGYCN
jgi:hypothetical protein